MNIGTQFQEKLKKSRELGLQSEVAQKEAKRLLERWEEAVDAGDKQYARELLRNLMKKNREATELAKASFDLLEQAYDEKYSEGALCC